VNLAAFLQARCERDRILVSHSTWALIHEEVACTPKGEIALNGFHQPVKVYEVAEPTSPRTRVAHSPSDGRTEVDEELRARSARHRSSGGIA
jgi:class 3 adenylate cyclase